MNGKSEDIQAIQQLAADWRSGWLAGDAEALLSLYGDDPVILPQDHPALVGKDVIRPLYQSLLSEFQFSSDSKIIEIEATGDWGYLWSSYNLTARPKAGGDPIKSTGKTLFILHRQPGGTWKIMRLMDNSDGPAAEAHAGSDSN